MYFLKSLKYFTILYLLFCYKNRLFCYKTSLINQFSILFFNKSFNIISVIFTIYYNFNFFAEQHNSFALAHKRKKKSHVIDSKNLMCVKCSIMNNVCEKTFNYRVLYPVYIKSVFVQYNCLFYLILLTFCYKTCF